MLGILVFGDNHLIVAGPRPDPETARRLVRQWSVIPIGPVEELPGWRIVTRALREELEWAVVVGERSPSAAVEVLLAELAARGVDADAAPRLPDF